MDLLQAICNKEDKEIKAFLIELMEARQTIGFLKSNLSYIKNFVDKSTDEIDKQNQSLSRARDYAKKQPKCATTTTN